LFDKIKFDMVFNGIPTDVRMRRSSHCLW
jgi:hypothetical protein